VGASHPDLLAAQFVPEGLQEADLVGDALHPEPPPGVLLDDEIPPVARHHPVEGDVLVGAVEAAGAVRVPLEQL